MRSAGGGERALSQESCFACFEISLSRSLSLSQSLTRSGHVRPPRHVPLQTASERERQESCRGRKRKKGREGLEEERERYEESGGRGNSEDYRTNKH